MATHDYNIANQSGADFRADLNNALSAILSNNASATEPTTTTAYMLWVDTGNNLLKIRNSDDNAWITLPVSITTSNTVDIDGGTVNTITSFSFSSGATVTTILDEDDLSSDSASALATQQSIKAYVDSQVTAQDLDFQGDTGGALSIDLDSETFTISGGNGIATSGALNTLTIAIDSSVVTLTDTQTLTNKSIDADSNTISNLEVDNLKSGVLDTDLTSVSASDDTLASSKAIKTYVDAQVTAQDLDLTDGTTSISIDLDSEELSVLGGTGVTSTASGNGVTLAIGQDVGTTADVTFNTVAADLTGDVTGTVSSIANHSTSDLTEGTNLYYTTARFDSAFSGKSTSDLTEGTNLYFTDARARAAISASGDLSYNSTTGVISFTERTDAEVRGLVSASGDLSYNSTTGVFSFTERTDSEVRGLLSGGTGVTYNNTTGVISIGQAVGTSDNVTFGDVIVSGDLTVSGTTTTINTETINLADNIILFNSNATGTPSENAGIEIERGDATNKTLIWNETDDKWTVGSETFVAGTFEGALTGNVTGTVSSIANHDTGDLAEGTNLYYTTARFDSAFSGKSTSDLTEGTNLYYTTARANSDFDTRLATKSTSDLAEGTNLYYTDARFDTRLATKTTDNLTEGSTNLYYTDARVDSHLSGGTGVTYSSGTISIGQAVGTGDSVTFAGVTSDFTGDIEGAVKFTAKADVALTKGQVVYISGVSGTVPTVNLADADNTSAMPAFGLVAANANQNAEVEIITFGSLTGLNTSAFTVGKSVYVSTTAGALTTTAPTGESSLIQNIGQVQRSHASAGIIKVGGAGRTNATPNLNSGKIFYGNGSNQSVATTLDTSIVPENTNLYYTDARARSAISVSGNALSYNSSTGVITSNYEESPTFTGTVTVTGEIVANGGIALGDGDQATFGDSDDLLIYHDGSNSYVRDTGTGDLRIQATNLRIEATSGEDYLYCASDGAVTLYYDNAAKLATTSTGINVTGTATMDGLTVSSISYPTTDGTSGQILTTDGAGTLSFADAAAGYSDSDVETYLNTSAIYTDATNDRLGIGIASPQAYLHVYGNNAETLRLEGNDEYTYLRWRGTVSATGTNLGYIGFAGDTGTAADLNLTNQQSGGDISIRTNSGSGTVERVRINASGKISAGTTSSPSGGSVNMVLAGTTAAGLQLSDTAGNGGAALLNINDELAFYTHSGAIGSETYTEAMRLDSSGNVGIGTSSPQDALHVKNPTSGVGSTQVILEGVAAGYGTGISFQSALTGGSLKEMARIVADGSASWNTTTTTQDARLRFFTTNDGTESEKMVIAHDGDVGIGTSSPVAKLHVIDATNGSGEDEGMVIRGNASNTGITNNAALLGLNAAASNSSNYRMIQCNSNTTTSTVDAEFIVYGNGNVVADGTFSGNGADYAEFFESTDGTAIPRGTSIVIENGKVRAATSEDDVANIIGVARPKEDGTNSMVIGNTAWNNWTNKYLTDDFGVFIMEEFTSVYWTDIDEENKETYHDYMIDRVPEGITVPDNAETKTHDELGNPLIRRTLNPDYDESQTYTPRLERDEWIIVGLMGQVQILKGQPVNDRWIKMRDISDTVEEWYIR